MSAPDGWRDGTGGFLPAYGRASERAQVYQSGANQYVTHIHVTAEARGRAAHNVRQRADVVVQALTRALGELEARCQELEEQARRAKAEGRAEAHAEFAERLRGAELHVIQAQRTMRQAEEERARAEALLAQAQRELARHRRAADRGGEAEPRDAVGLDRDAREADQLSDLLDRAERELGSVREDLRQLGEEINGRGGERGASRVIEGEWTRPAGTDARAAPVLADAPDRDDFAPPVSRPSTGSMERNPVPGPPRRSRIGAVWVVCVLPPWVPMLVVTTARAAFASDASLWGVLPFVSGAVLVGGVAVALGLSAALLAVGGLKRDSEQTSARLAFGCCLLGSVVFFVAGFFTPPDWPGPAGQWGWALTSAVGLG
ncbi:hypothetical protein JNUCC64_06935 [Streptomyces sp. JNUCC 64]